MIFIKKLVFNPVQVNTYMVYDDTKECVIIDPGMSNISENQKFAAMVEKLKLKPVKVLLTHAHFDHVLGCTFVSDRYELLPEGCSDDEFILKNTKEYAAQFGFALNEAPPLLDNYFAQGDKVCFGNSTLEVIHVPGHSPGSLLYYHPESGILLSGDVLFAGSIGRSDLVGGNHKQLIDGIYDKLLTLPDTVKVYPGHGAETTILNEKSYNPFLRREVKKVIVQDEK
ncbi:MAG: MBL fold metallo-hydrolase [Cytophagaceae bacterium]|jgi:glyoxylase-like metal-dependent hydrolase (beta-lactamase superfamily II)|nr:MBL fold metallo-hydrolase [Cytophagaceae bacterium]